METLFCETTCNTCSIWPFFKSVLSIFYAIHHSNVHFSRGLFELKEDPATGEWEELSPLCLGDDELCPGALAGQDIATFITSTGEDEGGELYITGMSTLSLDASDGVVYQLVDPARYWTSALHCCVYVMYTHTSSLYYRRSDPDTCKKSKKFTI